MGTYLHDLSNSLEPLPTQLMQHRLGDSQILGASNAPQVTGGLYSNWWPGKFSVAGCQPQLALQLSWEVLGDLWAKASRSWLGCSQGIFAVATDSTLVQGLNLH